MKRTINPVVAASLTLVLLLILFVGACMTAPTGAGHENAVDLGTHLKSLAKEHRNIAAAVRARCDNDVIEDDAPCMVIAETGLATGKLINTAHVAFDVHRLNTNSTITAAGVDNLIKSAEVSMVALKTLVVSVGITWEEN